MKFTSSGDKPLDFLKNFQNILKYIKDLSPNGSEIEKFYIHLKYKDSEIVYNSEDEYRNDFSNYDYSNLVFFLIAVNLNYYDDHSLEIYGLCIGIENNKFEISLETCKNSPFSNSSKLKSIISEIFQNYLPKSKLYKYNPEDEELRKVSLIKLKCKEILENLPNLQSMMHEALIDEKDLQKFLWPVLKSHFSDMWDENYLPEFAGNSFKPDFGIPSGRLLIETKFLKTKADIKNFRDEIAVDVQGYFRSNKEYTSLIVLIYNSNGIALPNNYISDLEKIPEIYSVINSPGVKPN